MKTYTKITEELKKNIINYYNSGKTIKETAIYLNIGYVTAKKYLDLSGKKNRKSTRPKPTYSIDETFFEQIDTHKKAQILGMIYADGCLLENGAKNNNSFILNISLQHGDIEYLHQLNNIIKNTKPIKTTNYKITHNINWTIHIKNRQATSLFQTCNYKICKDIQNLGIFPRKSLTCDFPTEKQVPEKFINSFLLGVYEGDGSFTFSEEKLEPSFQLICSELFAIKMKEKVLNLLNIHCSVTKEKRVSGLVVISVSGNNQVIKFMDWLYKNSDNELILRRKLEKYIKFKIEKENRNLFLKTDEFKKQRQEKVDETLSIHSGNKYRNFYIKNPEGVIYFSNRLNQFYKKYNLNPRHASELLNYKRLEYKGWKNPTTEEIEIAKINNSIIEEYFESKIKNNSVISL